MTNSLGIDKPVSETRVVVAMSGGVDSSVVAAMLKDEGYDVIGITLQLYDHGKAIAKKNACCAGQDIKDAARVAEQMGFPHYVLDYESRFRQDVIDDFADSYLRGETPIPCVQCNQTVKFRDLLKTAKDLDADVLATGHYVQQKQGNIKSEMHRGADQTKDQSYFLFSTTQEQLDFLRFPLGHMNKDETRQLARKYDLIVSDKPDSQDICFVPNGKYADLVEKLRPEAIVPGKIKHVDGREMGDHKGIIHYTIGQRKGLNLGDVTTTDPLYVLKIDADTQEVIVGPKEALAKKEVMIQNVNWIGDQALSEKEISVDVKLRSVQKQSPAMIRSTQDGSVIVTLHDPEYGVSPGQACVFYADDRVLGGGWIKRH